MVHLRIVVPPDRAEKVHALLCETASAIDVIRVPDASTRPDGDLIMCDVAREDASVIISDLRELGIHHDGSISISSTDTISDLADGRGRARARLAGRRRHLGGARPAHQRERRAVGGLPALHGPGRDHRRDRDLPRLADPGRGRDGRGARVRPGRRRLRRGRPAQAASSRAARRWRSSSASRSRSAPPSSPRSSSTASTSSPMPSTRPTTRWPRASRARTRSRSSSRSARAPRACSASRRPSPAR